jgi:hypothetical protein
MPTEEHRTFVLSYVYKAHPSYSGFRESPVKKEGLMGRNAKKSPGIPGRKGCDVSLGDQ